MDRPVQSPPIYNNGNTEDSILAAKYGFHGGRGLTKDQIARCYGEAAIWSNEVF
jgi:hypothetical protein